MSSQIRPLMEYRTTLSPAAVLEAAKAFFSRRSTIYAAFVEQESARHVSMRGQGGEEIVIAADPTASEGITRVTGSTYVFDFHVLRFFTTLPPAPEPHR
jgi:hypothetical protein